MTAALLTVGWAGASAAYDHFYGPAHPESSTALLPVDRVAWVWSGAVTDTSFRVTARIDDEAASQAALLVTGAGETRSAGPEDMPESGVP